MVQIEETIEVPIITPEPELIQVAIVLDDWGYNLDAYPVLEQIDFYITLAVLPHLPYTQKIAEESYFMGHEVILHMPMEPLGDVALEKKTLLTTMADDEVKNIVQDAIADIPYVSGVSNHMGSRFTQDERGMKTVLETVQEQGHFFLDSFTTHESVVGQIASQMTLTVIRRDVFLDNELNEEHIQGQIDRLLVLAKKRGYAIGIGHDKVVTLRTLEKNLNRFAEEGIELVKHSELLEKKSEQDQGTEPQ